MSIVHEHLEDEKSLQIYLKEDLISYRDPSQFSDKDMELEMARVYSGTAIERIWFQDHIPFEDDELILKAAESGELVRVQPTIGVLPIQRLVDYTPERIDPSHEFHYSPPFLRPEAEQVLRFIGFAWNKIQIDDRQEPLIFLPVTSLVRSDEYQRGLTKRTERKVAIDNTGDNGDRSSHEFGCAFDIDATGLYRYDPVQGHVQFVNPREKDFNEDAELVTCSREDLRGVLEYLKDKNVINFVEELPGTKEWVFHICINPNETKI